MAAKKTIPNAIAVSKKAKVNPEILYKGSEMPGEFIKRMDKVSGNNKKIMIATADATRRTTGVELNRAIPFVNFTSPTYNDGQLSKIEAATRRNLAIRTGITVRRHFAFGKSSKLVIELNESDKLDKDEGEQAKEVERLTKEHIEILKKITNLDEKVELVEHTTGPFYWQNLMFGRGVIVRIFEKEDLTFTKIKKLIPVNSRRLGLNILDHENDMEFEGIYVDGYALDRLSMIYGVYQDVQISPYTEHYGYSAIEPIVHIAESHNIATEEDIKEILKSAWLKAILFIVNTAGLNATQARTQITTIIDTIDPGKYIGVNTDVKEAVPLDLDPNYAGIISMVDSLESKIFKALHVPQFLVQSEDMANMATANKSASLFIDGIIAHDQSWLTEILWKQWYEPLLRTELKLEEDEDNPSDDYKTLPFKIKRIWDKPTVEEFSELASSLAQLVGSNIWDINQANKILQTPEVAKRVQKEIESQEKSMPSNPNDPNQPGKSPIDSPDNSKPGIKTGATIEEIRGQKLELLKELNAKLKKSNAK